MTLARECPGCRWLLTARDGPQETQRQGYKFCKKYGRLYAHFSTVIPREHDPGRCFEDPPAPPKEEETQP